MQATPNSLAGVKTSNAKTGTKERARKMCGPFLVSCCGLHACAARTAAAAAAALSRLIAVAAIDRTITARFERNRRRLTAAGADHGSPLRRSRAITGAPLIVFLCHTACFAAFGSGKTAFLEERLIGSGERKILPAVAASKLNISGHGVSSCADCTLQTANRKQGLSPKK